MNTVLGEMALETGTIESKDTFSRRHEPSVNARIGEVKGRFDHLMQQQNKPFVVHCFRFQLQAHIVALKDHGEHIVLLAEHDKRDGGLSFHFGQRFEILV